MLFKAKFKHIYVSNLIFFALFLLIRINLDLQNNVWTSTSIFLVLFDSANILTWLYADDSRHIALWYGALGRNIYSTIGKHLSFFFGKTIESYGSSCSFFMSDPALVTVAGN
jgi:hypothetical protein